MILRRRVARHLRTLHYSSQSVDLGALHQASSELLKAMLEEFSTARQQEMLTEEEGLPVWGQGELFLSHQSRSSSGET